MRAVVSIIGTDILCRNDEGDESRIPLNEENKSKLEGWTGRYRQALKSGDPSPLAELGTEMFEWLDQASWASKWAHGAGDRILEIAVESAESDEAAALLDVPWETLTCQGQFLA